MTHRWEKFKKGLGSVGKVAAGIGAIAVAAHGIHKGLELHNDLSQRRAHQSGWEPAQVEHHGVAKTVKF